MPPRATRGDRSPSGAERGSRRGRRPGLEDRLEHPGNFEYGLIVMGRDSAPVMVESLAFQQMRDRPVDRGERTDHQPQLMLPEPVGVEALVRHRQPIAFDDN